MIEPDFRALCARALSALEYHTHQTRPIHQTNEVMTALSNALAFPKPDAIAEFMAGCKALPEETRALLTPQTLWRLYGDSQSEPAQVLADDSKPLWEVIAEASVSAVFNTSNVDMPVVNCRIAAELRASADWIEEKHKRSMGIIAVGARTVAGELRVEADRAEAGRKE